MPSTAAGARAEAPPHGSSVYDDDLERARLGSGRPQLRAWAYVTLAILITVVGTSWMISAVANEYGSESTLDLGWSMSRLSVDDVATRPGMFEGHDVSVTGLVKVDNDNPEPLLPDAPTDSFELSDDDGPAFNDRVRIVNETGAPVEVVEDALVEVQGRVVVATENPLRPEVVIVAQRIRRQDPADKQRRTIENHAAVEGD
ncbi:MAG: hypothetical protein H6713_03900 [Myxococcales bacterium]|nr:hypothetical protein [Myxococcales bacterium]MCB9749133.1 hypothetical protein [Myxococcales bacterium]